MSILRNYSNKKFKSQKANIYIWNQKCDVVQVPRKENLQGTSSWWSRIFKTNLREKLTLLWPVIISQWYLIKIYPCWLCFSQQMFFFLCSLYYLYYFGYPTKQKQNIHTKILYTLYSRLQNVNKVLLDSRLGPTLSCLVAENS